MKKIYIFFVIMFYVLAFQNISYAFDYSKITISGASASNEYHPATRAADGLLDSAHVWEAYPVGSGCWIKYNITEGAIVTQYIMYAFQATYYPTGWELQGSNDNATWFLVDSRSAQTFTNNESKTYNSFTNTTAYIYYRLYFTGLYSNDLILSEWEIYSGADTMGGMTLDEYAFIIGLLGVVSGLVFVLGVHQI
jgi:hypothetical protein